MTPVSGRQAAPPNGPRWTSSCWHSRGASLLAVEQVGPGEKAARLELLAAALVAFWHTVFVNPLTNRR